MIVHLAWTRLGLREAVPENARDFVTSFFDAMSRGIMMLLRIKSRRGGEGYDEDGLPMLDENDEAFAGYFKPLAEENLVVAA